VRSELITRESRAESEIQGLARKLHLLGKRWTTWRTWCEKEGQLNKDPPHPGVLGKE